MSKGIKILIGIVGGLVGLAGLFWAVMEITAQNGIKHLYDKKVNF